MDMDALRSRLADNNQSHLLDQWDSLTTSQQEHLYTELDNIDFAQVNIFFSDAMHPQDTGKVDDIIEPIPPSLCGCPVQCSSNTLQSYRDTGYKAISSGEVAVILLAGGQGTRLGVPYPKGMYHVGLHSGKTLYQIQAERLQKVQSLAEDVTGQNGVIPWYIMTSEHTKQPTQQFFDKHNHFGLDAQNVILFEQNQLPAFTFDGKIILSKPDSVALSPDGNGGLYKAIQEEGILDDMQHRGVKYTYVYCVDNILVRIADPEFVGFCIQRNTDCAAVVVEKSYPTESVGVVCKVGGIYQVVEYSEISLKTAERRNPDGNLTFCHGNICNHFFSVEFLRQCIRKHQSSLKHHVAKKKVAYVTEDGSIVNPTVPNAIKMEKFVFDVFQFATDRNFAVWNMQRESAFSPLKNADGAAKDTPTTCRQSLYNLHVRYIEKAGGKVVLKDGTPALYSHSSTNCTTNHTCHTNGQEKSSTADDVVCEISPLVTYAGEGLEEICDGKTFISPVCIDVDNRGTIKITQGKH